MKAFEDENIFKDAAVYSDSKGKQWLRETDGDIYSFFEEVDDAYIFRGKMLRHEDKDIKSEHERFCEE